VYVATGRDHDPATFAAIFLSSTSIDLGHRVDHRALLRRSQKPAKIADFLHALRRVKVLVRIVLRDRSHLAHGRASGPGAVVGSPKKIFQQPLENAR
jgi:hypothetical protein